MKTLGDALKHSGLPGERRYRVVDGLFVRNPDYDGPVYEPVEPDLPFSNGTPEQQRKRGIVDRKFQNWKLHARLQETRGKTIADWHAHFDSLDDTEDMGIAIDMMRDDGCVDGPLRKHYGIGFVGAPGCGKTSALTALLRHRRKLGDVCLFLDFNEMIQMCATGFAPKGADAREYSQRDARTRLQMFSVDTLMWDDIGRKPLSDTAEEAAFRVIDTRMIHDRMTLWTTNVPVENLKENVGGRIWDRLRTLTAVVQTKAKSVRLGSDNVFS